MDDVVAMEPGDRGRDPRQNPASLGHRQPGRPVTDLVAEAPATQVLEDQSLRIVEHRDAPDQPMAPPDRLQEPALRFEAGHEVRPRRGEKLDGNGRAIRTPGQPDFGAVAVGQFLETVEPGEPPGHQGWRNLRRDTSAMVISSPSESGTWAPFAAGIPFRKVPFVLESTRQ